jgi:hypothetical protein
MTTRRLGDGLQQWFVRLHRPAHSEARCPVCGAATNVYPITEGAVAEVHPASVRRNLMHLGMA